MKKKLTNKILFSAIIACIETTFRNKGVLETIKYKLIKTESNYKITMCTNYYEEYEIEDTILFETKHHAMAVKMFADIATKDINEMYITKNLKIGL